MESRRAARGPRLADTPVGQKETAPPMKTVLVIDDEPIVCDTCGIALANAGYQVVTASSGLEGLEKARRFLPDLILCDITMPGMSGRQVLEAIRNDADLGWRQFVFMTGNARDITPRRGMELGADDFLVKPFSGTELRACISARLRRASVHWRVEDKMVTGLRENLHSVLPHEFFTSLNGVLGLVEVLRSDMQHLSPEEVKELLDEIEQSGWRLHRTLRNYLLLVDSEFLANASPARTGVETSDTEMRDAVNNGAQTAANRYRRGGDLVISVEPCRTHVDPSSLALMVEELVDNACKFSRSGTPVSVSLNTAALLTVHDSGRGMTDAQLAQIGAFQQFDRKQCGQSGFGLGLALVRKFAESQGSALKLRSRPGEGTTAEVQLA